MSRFTKRQIAAINKANKMLKKEPWYTGVRLNRVPSELHIKYRGVHWAAKDIWLTTYLIDCY